MTAAYTRATLRELFGLTTYTWATYEKAIARLPDGAPAQPVAGSGWPALRDALFHAAAAWDDWLRDHAGASHTLDWSAGSIETWDDMQAIRRPVREWLSTILERTPEDELQRPQDGLTRAPMAVSVADVLAHILLHERGHHGDITTLITKLGGPMLAGDHLNYIYVTRQR